MKILLVDTNRGSYPIYKLLTVAGNEVSVVGKSESAPLAKLCRNYFKADYTRESDLEKIMRDGDFSAIVPGCTDASYMSCSRLSRSLIKGIDATEVVDQLFQKQALRDLALSLGILQPRELSIGEALKQDCVIVKPVDGFSGGGITKIKRPTPEVLDQAVAAACQGSPSGKALIEEYVEGQLYSHSAFIHNQVITHDFFVQEDCIDYPYAVDTSCIALDLADPVKGQVRADMQRLAQHQQLVDGLLHSQFLVRDGHAYLLEITRRHPGDLYGLLIQHATGFDYAAHYLNGFLPEPIDPRDVQQEMCPIIRHTITAGEGCDFWSLRFHEPVKIRQWVPLAVAGDYLPTAPKGRAAIVFFEADSQEELANLYKGLISRSIYSFDN